MQRFRRLPASTFFLIFAAGIATQAAAQDPKVAFEGGVREGNPQYFDWTVINHYTSPIIKIEIPHTNGDTLEPPPNWTYEWLKDDAAPRELGKTVCRATPRPFQSGIVPGARIKISMRVNRVGAMPRPGKVRVEFADGSTYIIKGVELPSGHGTIERGIVTITLGAAFTIFLIYHARRQKRQRAAAATIEKPDAERADRDA